MLSTRSILRDLSDTDRSVVHSRCKPLRVDKKEEVITQGSEGRDMFIVMSGQLKISALSEQGKELAFGLLGPGDTFGEMGMLDGQARSATVTTIEPCELLVLARSTFEQLVRDYPSLAINLMVILSQRLRHTSRLYEDAVFLGVQNRLARFLIHTSRAEDSAQGTYSLDVSLSQYELGTLVNASRESINKLLNDWEECGWIEREKGKIRIVKPDELKVAMAL